MGAVLDGVNPDLTDRARRTLERLDGVHAVTGLRLRWSGHRLALQPGLTVDPATTVGEVDRITALAGRHLRHALPGVGPVDLTVTGSPLPVATPVPEVGDGVRQRTAMTSPGDGGRRPTRRHVRGSP